MALYEIRIIKRNGVGSLVYACQYLTDSAAIAAASRIARDNDDAVEVWRGMDCVHRSMKFARTG